MIQFMEFVVTNLHFEWWAHIHPLWFLLMRAWHGTCGRWRRPSGFIRPPRLRGARLLFLGGGTGAARKPPNPLFERSTPPIFVGTHARPCLLLSSSPPFHPSSPPPRRFGSSCFLLLVSASSLLPSFFSQLIRLPQCPSSSIPPHSPHPFPLFSPLLCMCLLRLHYETPSATHLCFPPPPFSNQLLLPRHLFQPTLHGGHLHPFFFMLSRQRSPPPPVFLEEPPRLLRKKTPCFLPPLCFFEGPPFFEKATPPLQRSLPPSSKKNRPLPIPHLPHRLVESLGPFPSCMLARSHPPSSLLRRTPPVFRTCPLPPYFKAAPGSKKNPCPFPTRPPLSNPLPPSSASGWGRPWPRLTKWPPSPFKERYSFNK